MQRSNVSGGFWLQNPQVVTDNLGTDKMDIQLECLEPCQHQDKYMLGSDGSQTRWTVVYLPRKSGSGMSGGWIHFAIDHVSPAAVAQTQPCSVCQTVRHHFIWHLSKACARWYV